MSEHRERRLDQQVRTTIGKLLQESYLAQASEEMPPHLLEVLKKLEEKAGGPLTRTDLDYTPDESK
jgi:hypothetical protein